MEEEVNINGALGKVNNMSKEKEYEKVKPFFSF